ncbi:hypothetical protein OOT00_09650 [Desulfobotulus sp. H1]|uniref:Uncharacterized protein n=1 Tax=Desulfobotulus pelophilus TaxID=2823377 RepID=A0ABT3N9V9_9BACT|nr:hypothetical protein [Desulfobotulus pelophilus]MCW7754250.1 hypothetical protein [Desulfobotulus pelophilus]
MISFPLLCMGLAARVWVAGGIILTLKASYRAEFLQSKKNQREAIAHKLQIYHQSSMALDLFYS